MTFIIDVFLQIVLSVLIPLWIIRSVYLKSGNIRKIIILPFFLLDWLMRAFTAVLFFGTMSSFLEWVCDACVFVLPFVAMGLANKVCAAAERNQSEKNSVEITSNLIDAENAKEQVAKEPETKITKEVVQEAKQPPVTEENCGNARLDEKLFCRKCGTQLLLDSVFCNKCGTRVETYIETK